MSKNRIRGSSAKYVFITLVTLINTPSHGIPYHNKATSNSENIGTKPCINIADDDSTLALDEIMTRASRNAQINSLQNLVNSSEYTLKSSKQYYVPKLITSGSYAYYSVPTSEKIIESGEYITTKTSPKYQESAPSITLNQNIFNLSQQSLILSNLYQVKVQKYQTQSQAQSNALSAAQLYISLIQNYNTMLSVEKVVKSYKEQYEATFKLKKAGEASLVDLLSAKAQVELYQQQVLQYKSAFVTAKANLQTAVNGQICDMSSKNYLQFPSVNAVSDQTNLTIEEATSTSPLINTYKSSAKSSLSLSQYYKRSYLPSFSVQAGMSGTYEWGNISGTSSTTSEYYLSSSPYAQLSFNWTIYDGGSNISLANSQIESAKSSENLINQTKISLENQIKSYQQNDGINEQVLQKAASQLKINEKLTSLVSIGYKAGYLTYLNFQVQAGTLYNSYLGLFSAKTALLNNRLQYSSLLLFKEFGKTYNSLMKFSN